MADSGYCERHYWPRTKESKMLKKTTQVMTAALLLVSGMAMAGEPVTLETEARARLCGPLDDVFVGPFRDWVNVKTEYGAVGDGKADDTAALQAALDGMRGDKAATEPLGETIYLPAGTYRITRTLTMESHLGVAVYGEDPKNTVIVWDGPGHKHKAGDRPAGVSLEEDKAATMLFLNGVRHARFGRITWDGRGKALTAIEHEWDRKVTGAATMLEHEDEVFKDVGFGLRAGNMGNGSMDAEGVVKRCRFIRNSFTGVSIESFNALNWWVFSSIFEDCRVGAGNEFGAGAVHVYNSLFLGSREADIRIMHVTSFYSARHNVSLGSRRFYESRRHPSWPVEHNWSGLFTLQDNLVLDTQEPDAVFFESPGPLALLDNRISGKAGAKGPAVRFDMVPGYEADCVAVGNRFTQVDPLLVKGRLFDQENTVAERAGKVPTADELKGMLSPVAPRFAGAVIDVKPGDDLQAAVDKAARMKGKRPLIYLGRGTYDLAKTLRIPARSDLQLVGHWGEGCTTVRLASDSSDKAVIAIEGPSHATVRRLSIHGVNLNDRSRGTQNYGTGLQVTGIDQPGARVWGPRMKVRNCSESAVWADGLRHARLQLFNTEIQYNGTGLRIDGPIPPGKRFDRAQGPLHVLYNGNTSANDNTYALTGGARLVARDLWYEGPQPRFFVLSGRADFTLNGAQIATSQWHGGKKPEGYVRPACIEVQPAFEGRLALIGTQSWSEESMHFDNQPERGQVLLLASLAHTPKDWLCGDSAEKKISALYNRGFKASKDGTVGLPQRGKDDAATVLRMFADLRSVRPESRKPLADDVTDLCLHDVFVRWCEVGVRVSP
jgi:hypothetical protein